MDRAKLVNIPNLLTLVRILLVPVFVILYFELPLARWAALIVFIAAALTDMLDGYLARKWGQITWFGKLFDPLADKLMTLSMLFCLCKTGEIPIWVPIVFLLREAWMVLGASLLFRRGVVVKSDILGKTATLCLVVSLCLVYPWHALKGLRAAGTILLYIAMGLSLAAMAHYTFAALKRRRISAQ